MRIALPSLQEIRDHLHFIDTRAMGYLTLWPQGAVQPIVSTLNALDGWTTSNMAILPTANGFIAAYASGLTHLRPATWIATSRRAGFESVRDREQAFLLLSRRSRRNPTRQDGIVLWLGGGNSGVASSGRIKLFRFPRHGPLTQALGTNILASDRPKHLFVEPMAPVSQHELDHDGPPV
jgi:hypothetical protein